MEKKGVKSPSIRKAKAAMSAMLATAAQAGDVQANAATGVRYVPSPSARADKTKRRKLTDRGRGEDPRRRRAALAAVLPAAGRVRAAGWASCSG